MIGLLRRRRRHAAPDAARIADLERELRIYDPVGNALGPCPRCGGHVVLSTEPESGWTYLCASCSIDALGRPEWAAFLYECCGWAGEQRRSCQMSGCCHARWRREAGFRWRQERCRLAYQLADSDDFVEIRGGSTQLVTRLLRTPVEEVLARHPSTAIPNTTGGAA